MKTNSKWRALTAVMTYESECVTVAGLGTFDPVDIVKPKTHGYHAYVPYPGPVSRTHPNMHCNRGGDVLFEEWSRDPVILAELWRNAENLAAYVKALRTSTATPVTPRIDVAQVHTYRIDVHVFVGPSAAVYSYATDPLRMVSYRAPLCEGVRLYWAFSQLIEEELRKFLRDPLTGPLRTLYDTLLKQRTKQLERADSRRAMLMLSPS